MSIEDNIGFNDETETCVVCGKGLKQGETLATLHKGENKLPICCPLCLEAYQKDSKPYLDRLAKRTLNQEMRKLSGPPPGQAP